MGCRSGTGARATIPRSGFAPRFQQYTGPVMAKALEDTCFYRYNRLLSLNEVGGDPRQFGVTVSAFHHLMQERARSWPNALSPLAQPKPLQARQGRGGARTLAQRRVRDLSDAAGGLSSRARRNCRAGIRH